jgi:hypothetical protein
MEYFGESFVGGGGTIGIQAEFLWLHSPAPVNRRWWKGKLTWFRPHTLQTLTSCLSLLLSLLLCMLCSMGGGESNSSEKAAVWWQGTLKDGNDVVVFRTA